jgi:hypothetical protein
VADRRGAILAKLDAYALDHQPMLGAPETGCCPGGCSGDAVVALRAVVEGHAPEPWHHGDAYAEAHHVICQDVGMDHPELRCARCSSLDEDLSGVTVGYPCRELAAIAEALGVVVGSESRG